MQDWIFYHRDIRLTANAVNYDMRMDEARIVAEPFSRTGSPALELFDYSFVQAIDGYRHRVTLSWGYLHPAEQVVLRNLIVAIQGSGSVVIDFDPNNVTSGEPEPVGTLDVVIDEASSAIVAEFSRGAHKRPGSISFVERVPALTPVTWLPT